MADDYNKMKVINQKYKKIGMISAVIGLGGG